MSGLRLLHAKKGFTLVEVLVAMAIMAIIAVMAWQGVDGIVRTRTITTAKLEKLLRLNTILTQWEQDLNAIQDTKSSVPALAFNGTSVTLTRRTTGGLQLVVWSLRGGVWQRWAGPASTTLRGLQENWKASQQFSGNEVGQLKTLTDVSEWQIYFFRDNAWTNAQSSAGTGETQTSSAPQAPAPASAPAINTAAAMAALLAAVNTTPPLPQGVRVVISFSGEQGSSGKVTRDVVLGPQ
jgi:general secretion pathway protein J